MGEPAESAFAVQKALRQTSTTPASGWFADPAILHDLEALHGAALFGFVKRLGLTDDEAQDCVQETFLRLWSELQKGVVLLDPKAWAYRAVYRIAMDHHRLHRRIGRLLASMQSRAARAGPMPDDADRIAVWREVDRLPSRQRQVVYLRYRADLPFEDIAAILGLTASGARSHATQAVARLRLALRDDDLAPGHDQ